MSNTLMDIAHWWGNDINAASNADVSVVGGDLRVRQRILRRLMTNPADTVNNLPPDYILHPTYGAGLPRYVGSLVTAEEIEAVCIGQTALEDGVAASPPPTAQVQLIPDGMVVTIGYTDSVTGQPVVLSFNVSA
jgi:hypothetical protein